MGVRPVDTFLELVDRQFAISDFDTEHPICLWIGKKLRLTQEQLVWLSFLYMAYYDEASAWATFLETEPFRVPKKVAYPIGLNRRNLFGGRISVHFQSLVGVYRKQRGWPLHNFTGDHKLDWEILKRNIAEVWGNGRFAVYTTAEMLQKVAGVPVTITDFDNKNSSGPADGIMRLYGCEKVLAELDHFGERAYKTVVASGRQPTYTVVDRGVVESVLCNYSGICRGKFYSGRNVDRQQERILRVEEMGVDLRILWEARAATIEHHYLGEYSGWVGIDKDRMKHFQKTGELLWTHEAR